MLDAGQRVTRSVMTDFVAAASEASGFCKRDDMAIAHPVRPGKTLRTGRRSIRWRRIGNAGVGHGHVSATRLLLQRALRHLACDGFARQAIFLYNDAPPTE